MSRVLLLCLPAATLVALASCTSADVQLTCFGDAPLCDSLNVIGDERPPATGVDIVGVSVNQGVHLPIMEDGELVESDLGLPVIAGRDALFRVHVDLHDDFVPRTLTGRLYLYDGDDLISAQQENASPSGPSSDGDLDTTFNIEVSGSVLDAARDLRFRVEVVEASAAATAGGDPGDAVWPVDAKSPAALPLEDPLGPLKILLLPIQYDADGSGRLPDVSDEQVALIADYIYAMYPAAELELEVGDPFPTETRVGAVTGWDTLLYEVSAVRSSRGIPGDVYIYGIFAPADDIGTFCAAGCIAGLSSLAFGPEDANGRASIGLGYSGSGTAETMAHEVGHAHGRYHVDCGGAAGVDPDFPYAGGAIGSHGYNLVSGELYDGDTYADVMSYCWPYWVSDYQFYWLYDRIRAINAHYGDTASGRLAGAAPERWQSLWVMSDGTLRWGEPQDLLRAPRAEEVRAIELLAADGAVIERREVPFRPFDHLDGGILLLPDPGPRVASVRLARTQRTIGLP